MMTMMTITTTITMTMMMMIEEQLYYQLNTRSRKGVDTGGNGSDSKCCCHDNQPFDGILRKDDDDVTSTAADPQKMARQSLRAFDDFSRGGFSLKQYVSLKPKTASILAVQTTRPIV